MSLNNWLRLLTLALLWGGSFVFIGVALQSLTPVTIVAFRIGLAARRGSEKSPAFPRSAEAAG